MGQSKPAPARTSAKARHKRAKVPVVYQMEACECGAASLSMILRYYGCSLPMEQVRSACGVSRDGCNAADIVRAAKELGLVGSGYRRSLEDLAAFPTPCILHWDFNHFVVLEGVDAKGAYIADPARGRRHVTRDELDRSFTGVALFFKPGPDFKERRSDGGLATLVKRRLGTQGSTVAYLMLMRLVLVAPGLILPALSQCFIDDVLMRGYTTLLGTLLAAIAFSYAFQIVFTFMRSRILAKLRQKLFIVTGANLVGRLLRMPISFFQQRYPGELSQRVENNTSVNEFLTGQFSEAVLNALEAVFYLVLMLLYSPVLTGVGVLGVVVNVVLCGMVVGPLANLSMKLSQDSSHMSGTLCSTMSIFSTIKANGTESESAADLVGHYANTTDAEQHLQGTQQVVGAIPASIANVFNVLVLVLGGLLVIRGDCTAGALVAFCQLLAAFSAPVNTLVALAQKTQAMCADMARVEDILTCDLDARFEGWGERWAHPDQAPAESDLASTPLTGQVSFSHVTFGYNRGLAPTVSDFNLAVAPGTRVALVGASGCGKSTVARAASGLIYPWEGEVLFDGTPITRIPPEIVCDGVAVVNQDCCVFSGTLRDNVTMWNDSYGDDDLEGVVRDAAAEKLLKKLPAGFDSHLEEGGRNLSGGQRQQVEIMRALIKNPAVLLLDEATSSLDAETEKRVLDGIARRGCTCIMIAHRLSAVKDCDLIVVMSQGRAVQAGTHEQLSAVEGEYRRLLES